MKKLKKDEFLQLELEHLNSELLTKDKEILEFKRQLNRLTKSNLQHMIKDLDYECLSLKTELNTVEIKREKQKDKRNIVLSKIRKRLKLSGKFGYNPDTLEILED